MRSDFVLFTSFEGSFSRDLLEHLGDETGVEAFVNHLHLDDYLPAVREGKGKTIEASLAFVQELSRRLLKQFPEHGFRIIVSLGQTHEGVVRFHRIRDAQVWTADDLESYAEPIAIFEVGRTSMALTP